MMHDADADLGSTAATIAIFNETPDTTSLTIPDAQLLFTADFKRSGSDLTLTGEQGQRADRVAGGLRDQVGQRILTGEQHLAEAVSGDELVGRGGEAYEEAEGRGRQQQRCSTEWRQITR